MTRRLRYVPQLADGPFRGSTAIRAGLVTANELRGPGWQRMFRDVYVAAGIELTQEMRARGAMLVLPGAVVTGRSAAWLWGVDVDGPGGAARAGQVDVTVPPGGHRAVPGIRVRRSMLDPQHVGCVPWMRDIPVLWPEYAAVELAADPARSHIESVVLLDQFIDTGRVDLSQLRALGATRTGRGCRTLRSALLDADGLAGSPPETRLRLGMHAAGLPTPVAQYRLSKPSGQRVKALDFAWPHLRFAVEYDGATHVATSTRPEAGFHLPKDRRVLNEAQELGWRLHYVTAPGGRDMSGAVAVIAAALRSRAVELGVPLR